MAELFDSPKFIAAAQAVCPADKPVLDPFQFNFIIQARGAACSIGAQCCECHASSLWGPQVPGQTVAAHIDADYFWGADRFHVPQWLLAVMTFSGLWQDRFVDQVQVRKKSPVQVREVTWWR